MPKSLPTPSADTKSVQELVRLLVAGRIRVPIYQRDLEWNASDVHSLFDSIYRGFPIGSLLLHNRPAAAATLQLGPLTVHAPESTSAFDVVDGQQRLVALAASLARPEPIPTTPDDPYVVYFDPVEEKFAGPPPDGQIPSTWVPLPALADGSTLTEWVFNWRHAHDANLRGKVFAAGARIRDYKIPLYSVAVADDDADVLREIFNRVNSSGKPLKWNVIHDALYGARRTSPSPSTIPEVIASLAELGVGRMDEDEVLRCLIAFEGLDVTRSYKEHERERPRFLEGTAAHALPTLRRVLGFLRDHAEIVHLRLLPRSTPLSILTRFFRLHAEPGARSLELLTWWLWRGVFGNKHFDERTLQRRGVAEVNDDEEESVQRLLRAVPEVDPMNLTLPDRFDARAAETRIALVALTSLRPRDLESGRPVDVAELIERSDLEAFRRLTGHSNGPEDRILLPGTGRARAAVLAHLEVPNRSRDILASHAIPMDATRYLKGGEPDGFLRGRRERLTEVVRELAIRLTGHGRSARPSIAHLLKGASA